VAWEKHGDEQSRVGGVWRSAGGLIRLAPCSGVTWWHRSTALRHAPTEAGLDSVDNMASERDVDAWDAEADQFDDAADHGLVDHEVRAAWRRLLVARMPAAPARIADLGCGTGTLSVLLHDEGFDVDGIDFSPRMIERAEAKAAGRHGLRFFTADAYEPPLSPSWYDAVICRHVLWAMPDPELALRRWIQLLRSDGVLVLVEGRWDTGAGLTSDETVALVEAAGRQATLTPLQDPAFWGRPIADERYVVTSP
jgi:SAM-dependent methyltransferase